MSVNQVCQAYEFFSSVLTVERVAGSCLAHGPRTQNPLRRKSVDCALRPWGRS